LTGTRYFPDMVNVKIKNYDGLGGVWPDGRVPIFATYRDGSLWILARPGNIERVHLSKDGGETWQEIWTTGGGHIGWGVITQNPNENECVLIQTTPGIIKKSTDLTSNAHTDWQDVLPLDGGYILASFGWDLHENNIFLSTYGAHNAANPPRWAYRSKDYGETWQTIFEKPISEMANPAHYHIHDISFDPWTSRIWLVVGDTLNADVLYSDDNGTTWNEVYGVGKVQQFTTVIPLHDRVIFGSDSYPNGVSVLYKSANEKEQPVRPDDIKVLYTANKFSENFRGNYAIKPNVDRSVYAGMYPYQLIIPFTKGTTPEHPCRILATPDGEHWFEIFRDDAIGAGGGSMSYCVGPINNKIYARIVLSGHRDCWEIDMPKWIKVE